MQLLSQPSTRVVRLLGLRKGGVASSYSQLFLSFGISCFFHQVQMFNVTRRDMGELVFFMWQPVAIVAEDIVFALCNRAQVWSTLPRLRRVFAYAWTFAWFSFSLPFYVNGLVGSGVIKDWIFGYSPLRVISDAKRSFLEA